MTTVSHGKPYAGNLHVRFEEGDSASAEPRRKSLLHKKTLSLFTIHLSLFTAIAAFAATVTDVTVTPNAAGNFVTIGYTLDASAIVTLDVTTNGVSVGGANLRRVGGDVNRSVAAGARTIWWRPGADCDVAGTDVKAVIRTWSLDNPPDYTAFELTSTKDRRFYASEDALPYGIASDVYRTGWLLLRRIPATGRTFTIGSSEYEPARDPISREDAHLVHMTEDYWMGVFEITQGQWDFVYRDVAHNSYFTNRLYAATRPIDSAWNRMLRGIAGASTFALVSMLDTAVGLTEHVNGRGFDLPTEAKWEFACRAGTSTSLYTGRWLESTNGKGISEYGIHDAALDDIARYEANGGRKSDGEQYAWDVDPAFGTARVGSYRPNAFGLYDMIGNVFEITCEKYDGSLGNRDRYDPGAITFPNGDSVQVAVRGGSFNGLVYYCRAAQRVGPMAVAGGNNNAPLANKLAAALGYGCRVSLPIGK